MTMITSISEFRKLNEATDYSFTIRETDNVSSPIFKEILPLSVSSKDTATQRIKEYVGSKMFIDIFYIEFSHNKNNYKIHIRDHWLHDSKVDVSLVTMFMNDELIGSIYASTKALREDMKKYDYIKKP